MSKHIFNCVACGSTRITLTRYTHTKDHDKVTHRLVYSCQDCKNLIVFNVEGVVQK